MQIMSWPALVTVVVLWALSWVCGRSYFRGLSSPWLLAVSVISALIAANITATHAAELLPWLILAVWFGGGGL